MKSLVIKRSEWGRGQCAGLLVNLPSRGDTAPVRRCCLGFYGNQIEGIQDAEMNQIRTPSSFIRDRAPDKFTALVTSDKVNTKTCVDLMRTNDDRLLSDAHMERILTDLFKQIDVAVTFID